MINVQQINPIYFKNNLSTENNKKNSRNAASKEGVMALTSIGAVSMLTIGAGILSKGNFNKSIAKKGLELKNNLLVNKSTGEKFTGSIKSNIGKIGFNKTETRKYIDGVIAEKTYKNAFGSELEGIFYKDGKECMWVKVNYPFFLPVNKAVTSSRYNENKSATKSLDMRGFSGKSVFDWARGIVKEKGWFRK